MKNNDTHSTLIQAITLSTPQVADRMGLTTRQLQDLRLRGIGPPIVQRGLSIHYLPADVQDIERHEAAMLIEQVLASGGSYAPIRDVAAKAAENIARLAALFHMVDHGAMGTIDRICVDSAAQIVRWHLQEAHRLLGDLDAPPVMTAAIRFDAWLRDEAMRTGDGRIPTTRVYRYGPGCVRDNKELKDAVALLAEHGRARMEEEGRRRFVVVNPALYAA